MKISFLILHYKNINETTECIKSIIDNVKYDNYDIVIVDNGSNNNTGKELRDKYESNSKIKVIISKENLGFAKGNNIGFNYIKNNLDSDFIVMINSDTIIEQEDFCQKLIEKYELYKFDVCGIDIVLPDGTHTNPTVPNIKNVKDIENLITKFKFNIKMCKLKLDIINVLLTKVKTKIKRNDIKIDRSKDIISNKEIQLHGSAMIFSKTFMEKYDGLYDGTFLYFEEVSLRYICERDNLIVLYTPDIKIIHKESKSTKSIYSDWQKRHLFYYENVTYSATNLLNYIRNSSDITWKRGKNG